jgi:hypothetical protein
MSRGIVIDPNVEEEKHNSPQDTEQLRLPLYTAVCAAYPEDQGSLSFEFRAAVPEKPDVMSWLTFLFLSRHKLDSIYTAALEQAMHAYLEIRPESGIETAKEDIEAYLVARVASFEQEASEGIRIEDEDDES